MSRRAFEAMPLRERVRLIMDDQVQFLCAGKVVPAREALAKDTTPPEQVTTGVRVEAGGSAREPNKNP